MPRHHHTEHKNSKRHVIDYLLVLVIGASLFSLCTIFYYRYAVYARNVMSESVSASEYYEEQYDKFENELDLFLSAIGVPAEVVSDGQDLQSWYYFELRKKVLTEGREGSFEESVRDKIETPVRTYLSENNIGLSEEAEAGFENMLQSLENNLSEEISHPDIQVWNTERESFAQKSAVPTGAAALAAAAATVLLFLIQHYKYRAVHYMGLGIALGGAGGIAYVLYQYQRLHAAAADGGLRSIQLFTKNISVTGVMIPAAVFAVGLLLIAGESLLRQYQKR